MKKTYLFILMAISVLLATLTGCKEDQGDANLGNFDKTEAYANLNPDEPIILSVSNEKGESVVFMGSKDDTGHPEAVEQMIVTVPSEEIPTEVSFENNRIKEVIAPNGVKFHFEWISATKAALTLVDPNTNEQLNTVIDMANPNIQTTQPYTRGVSGETRKGDSKFTLKAIERTAPTSETATITRASDGIIGNVYLEQCGIPGSGQCWVNAYDYSSLVGSNGKGKFRGKFKCTEVAEGHYQFKLPLNYHEHHDLGEYCHDINDVLDKICTVNSYVIPGSKQYLCYVISGVIASGVVSAPVAALFNTACLSISTALDAACGIANGGMDLPEGMPNIADGLCNVLKEMDYTWDTPLYLEPVLCAMPSNIYGPGQIYEANTELKDMRITWTYKPSIISFELNPAAPDAGEPYTAIANLSCMTPGTKVIMTVSGTDGYHDQKSTVIEENAAVNYQATLYVRGAKPKVKDICTIQIITTSGQTITKKASLVFNNYSNDYEQGRDSIPNDHEQGRDSI